MAKFTPEFMRGPMMSKDIEEKRMVTKDKGSKSKGKSMPKGKGKGKKGC
jgi:hypothetical protein